MLVALSLLFACKHEVEPLCDPNAAPWTPGTPVFTEVSEAWGLTDILPEGVRISAVDLDHDGWTDLIVRRGYAGDDFADGGLRQTWLLRNDANGHFVDITAESGLVTTRYGDDPTKGRPGPIWVFGDVDNDGDLDAYNGNPDGTNVVEETSEVMLNDGTAHFALAPDESDIRRSGDMPFGASFIDYDRDGTLDLYVAEYDNSSGPQQSRLYHGNGDGTFADKTEDAGLVTQDWDNITALNTAQAHTRSWAATACDLNNDGDAELLAASYGRAPNALWVSNGDGTFANRSVLSGYAYDDNEDWTDNQSARCWCEFNRDDAWCADVPPADLIVCNGEDDAFRWDDTFDREPFRLGGNSGATQCADLDNDGWMDLVTSEIVHWDVGGSSDPSEILHNTQDAAVTFERPGNDVTGLLREHDRVDWNDGDMTGSTFDFDNDGWTDVYIGSSDYPGTRGLLWHQDAPLQFSPVPIEDGLDRMRAHGSVAADFDRDGDLDFVVGHSSSRCDSECDATFEIHMFENQLGGNFVQVELVGGDGSNRAAIGARVDVVAGDLRLTHQVDGGHGQFGAQDDLVQHFGLGANCGDDSDVQITVTWPDAAHSTTTFTVAAGHRWRIQQGAEEPELLDLPAEE